MRRRSDAGAGAAARCTPNERLRGRGDRGADLRRLTRWLRAPASPAHSRRRSWSRCASASARCFSCPTCCCNSAPSGRGTWLQGVPLTLFQGAGMGALVICGLQLAPANHAAALGPGRQPGVGRSARIRGVRQTSFAPRDRWRDALRHRRAWRSRGGALPSETLAVLAGDAMFLAASALGALYVLQLRTWGVGAIQGAAIVSLYSALVVVPWYLWSAPAPLWRVAPLELALAGTLAGRADRLRRARRAEPRHFAARRRALERVGRAGAGADRDSGARVSRARFLRSPRSRHSSRSPPASRSAPSRGYAGSPASSQRADRNARPAGYRVRDSAPGRPSRSAPGSSCAQPAHRLARLLRIAPKAPAPPPACATSACAGGSRAASGSDSSIARS